MKDDLEDSAHGDHTDSNLAEIVEDTTAEAEVADQLDAWSTGKGVKSAQSPSKPDNQKVVGALGDTLVNWWSMVVSLLTCIPARPKDA